MPFVYLLRCRGDALYCGWTIDLESRVAKHQAGTGARYTAQRGPVSLAAAWETETKTQARSLEGKIKRLTPAQKRALVAGEPLDGAIRLKDPIQPVNRGRTPT
jgi:putative endonuclease